LPAVRERRYFSDVPDEEGKKPSFVNHRNERAVRKNLPEYFVFAFDDSKVLDR